MELPQRRWADIDSQGLVQKLLIRDSVSLHLVKWAKFVELTNVLLLPCPYKCENSFIHSLNNIFSIIYYMQSSGSAQTDPPLSHMTLTRGLWVFLILSLLTHFHMPEGWCPCPSVTLTCSPLTSETRWVAWRAERLAGTTSSVSDCSRPQNNHNLSSSSHLGHFLWVPSLPADMQDIPWKPVFSCRRRVRMRAVWGRKSRIIAESTVRWLSLRLGPALSSGRTPGKPPPLLKASVCSSVKRS